MARFSEGPYNSYYWKSVSEALSTLEATRPFTCGRVLLEDEASGLRALPFGDKFAAVHASVSALYKDECADIDRWSAVEEQIKRLDFNTRMTDATDGVSWSEYKGLSVLLGLVRAAQAHLRGDSRLWRNTMAQAYLDCAGWMGDVAYARAPVPARPSAPLYEDRIREIAAHERALDDADRARDDRCDRAHADQLKLLQAPLERLRRDLIAAEEAEERRVAALPIHRRWWHHVSCAFANSAG
ncbi:MAG: hypothetical protein KGS72_04090 [Cyanobacteria bacterium REEB67]|nr:hypothetical protein [Cyanobacteria bacterium REEB67]